MTTLKDVAEAANVSPTTVSRIINGDSSLKVSDGTRETKSTFICKYHFTNKCDCETFKKGLSLNYTDDSKKSFITINEVFLQEVIHNEGSSMA